MNDTSPAESTPPGSVPAHDPERAADAREPRHRRIAAAPWRGRRHLHHPRVRGRYRGALHADRHARPAGRRGRRRTVTLPGDVHDSRGRDRAHLRQAGPAQLRCPGNRYAARTPDVFSESAVRRRPCAAARSCSPEAMLRSLCTSAFRRRPPTCRPHRPSTRRPHTRSSQRRSHSLRSTGPSCCSTSQTPDPPDGPAFRTGTT